MRQPTAKRKDIITEPETPTPEMKTREAEGLRYRSSDDLLNGRARAVSRDGTPLDSSSAQIVENAISDIPHRELENI